MSSFGRPYIGQASLLLLGKWKYLYVLYFHNLKVEGGREVVPQEGQNKQVSSLLRHTCSRPGRVCTLLTERIRENRFATKLVRLLIELAWTPPLLFIKASLVTLRTKRTPLVEIAAVTRKAKATGPGAVRENELSPTLKKMHGNHWDHEHTASDSWHKTFGCTSLCMSESFA